MDKTGIRYRGNSGRSPPDENQRGGKASTAPAASPAPIPAMPEKPAAPVQTLLRPAPPGPVFFWNRRRRRERRNGQLARGIFGRKKGYEEPDMEEPGYAPAPSRPALAAEDEDDVRVYVPPVKKTVLPASEKGRAPSGIGQGAAQGGGGTGGASGAAHAEKPRVPGLFRPKMPPVHG